MRRGLKKGRLWLPGPCQIIERLPVTKNGEFQYEIRNTFEEPDRVARESELTLVSKFPGWRRSTPDNASNVVQCEDWQHERTGTEPLVCSWPPASLTRCACQADDARAPNSLENPQYREAGAAHSLLKQKDRRAAVSPKSDHAGSVLRWSRLSEQDLRFDRWSICQG